MSECGQWSNSYWRVRHQRSTAAVDQLICVTTLQCPDLSNNAQSWTMIIITVSQPESIRASFKRYHCVIVITKINYYYIFLSSSSGLHNASPYWPRKLRDLGDEEDERWWGPEHVQHVLTRQRYEQYPEGAGAGGGHHQTDQEHESSSSSTSS